MSTTNHPVPSLMTLAEVAEHLGVTERHVRRLVQERRMPYIKWGRLLRFDPVEVTGLVDDSRRGPRPRSC